MNNPWNEIGVPEQNLSVRRIPSERNFDLFWGKNPKGNYILLCGIAEGAIEEKDLPVLEGIDTGFIDSSGPHLSLELRNSDDWKIFLVLCNSLLSAVSEVPEIDNISNVILLHLRRWQEFLKRRRNNILSEQEIMGLIGELVFLRDELTPAIGAVRAVQAWQGPMDYPQDFNLGSCAIETKTRSGASGPHIRISSAEQLCPELPEMYLFVLTVGKGGESQDSISLPEVIASVREILSILEDDASETFEGLLMAMGYVDLPDYDKFRYVISSKASYLVIDDFPRIQPANLAQGISNVKYTIEIKECAPFLTEPNWGELFSDET